MNRNHKSRWAALAALAAGVVLWEAGGGCSLNRGKPSTPPELRVRITRQAYRGWPDAYVLRNGRVKTVVVPAIGRVMQFSFIGEEGVFWENTALAGQPALRGEWASSEWVNLGGDKSWPAPESDWSKFTGRKGWRPPPAFDALPVTARIVGDSVVLSSPVDPYYGIRVERQIRLHPGTTDMTIATTYERVNGAPAKVSIWVITQLKEPAGLFAPVPAASIFPNGYTLLMKDAPANLQSANGLVSLTRNPKASHKIGLDGGSLLWVGDKHVLRIDSPRVPESEYPDAGSSMEIYTNPDPLQYIELETLGPLQSLKIGERIQRNNTYTLQRRKQPTPEAEARAIYAR